MERMNRFNTSCISSEKKKRERRSARNLGIYWSIVSNAVMADSVRAVHLDQTPSFDNTRRLVSGPFDLVFLVSPLNTHNAARDVAIHPQPPLDGARGDRYVLMSLVDLERGDPDRLTGLHYSQF